MRALYVLVGDVISKVCVVICGCDVEMHVAYVPMDICVIYWLIWSIFVRSEVISASLAYIWLLS